MISVLIPVFNYNIQCLVNSINSQLISENIDFEIICIDDASTDCCLELDELSKLKYVTLYKLPSNVGRSCIRNLLVEKATFNWLLFLDADVFPKNENFIKEYVKCINSNVSKVYCGGIIYKKEKPSSETMLRWVYGKNREEASVEIRNDNQYNYFFTANFLIQKEVFHTCNFNESIVKYGYEDVLFVQNLKSKSIEIKHLSNEVYHLGIETSSVFLDKTRQAIENLHNLYFKNILESRGLKILIFFEKVNYCKLTWVFKLVYKLFHKRLEYNLKSSMPSIFIFDIYKLSYFCFIKSKN